MVRLKLPGGTVWIDANVVLDRQRTVRCHDAFAGRRPQVAARLFDAAEHP